MLTIFESLCFSDSKWFKLHEHNILLSALVQPTGPYVEEHARSHIVEFSYTNSRFTVQSENKCSGFWNLLKHCMSWCIVLCLSMKVEMQDNTCFNLHVEVFLLLTSLKPLTSIIHNKRSNQARYGIHLGLPFPRPSICTRHYHKSHTQLIYTCMVGAWYMDYLTFHTHVAQCIRSVKYVMIN